MGKGILSVGIVLLVVLSLIPVQAPKAGSGGTSGDDLILLKNIHINTNDSASAIRVAGVEVAEGDYYLIQFEGHVTGEYKEAAKAEGAVLYGYIPNNAYLARINASDYAAVGNLSCVKWIGPYLPAYKISPGLQEKTGTLNLTVVLFDPENSTDTAGKIEDAGGEITGIYDDTVYIRADTSTLFDIASIDEVEWIEEKSELSIMNDQATLIMNVTGVRTNYGLTGSGQIVAVADTGLDTGQNDATMHDDLEGRIVKIYDSSNDGNKSDTNGHGTHVAGSVLGNGALSAGKYAGAAPEAELVFQAIGNSSDSLIISDLTALFQQAYDDGARIHSNSWGSDEVSEYGVYSSESRTVDEFMWDNPDMLIVFSAGNEGNNGNGTVTPPGTAKNCLAVGATNNNRYGADISEIAYFSSRGPTDDGRIKPDVMAPGTSIISTLSSVVGDIPSWRIVDDYYIYYSGTSMSAPLTAGTAALVRQYYVDNESITPSAALIKATLINGATDLSSSSNDQGWGRVDLKGSFFPASPLKVRYSDGTGLDDSESWNTAYYIDGGSPIKISLVWTDYPASLPADDTLVNDLDLKMESPDTTVYYGNDGPDSTNNVEQICIANPAETGWYDISVTGTDVREGPQPFALVISADFDTEPPASVTGLGVADKNSTWINWTWTNPEDVDFSHTMIYIDGDFSANLSSPVSSCNVTGLAYESAHTISTRTVDIAGNVNTSWVNNSATTLPDWEPPGTVTGLSAITDTTRINWIWTNPTDEDFNHTVIYIDGNFSANLSTPISSYNFTCLENTLHEIGIRTVDIYGNINRNWVNDTRVASPDIIPPVIHNVSLNPSEPFSGDAVLITVHVSDNQLVSSVTADGRNLTFAGGFWNGTLTAGVGNHTINITATDASGNTNETAVNYTGKLRPVASFTASVTSGNKPLVVQFNDSSAYATGWHWDFGDGGTSEEREPVHTYGSAGSYDVTLSVSNSNATVSLTKEDYITVTTPTTSSGSSGGGGGGGGGSTGEDYDNILIKDAATVYLEMDAPATYEFTGEANPIISVDLTAKKTAGRIKILIEVLKDTSVLADEKPPGQVYKNINIWAGNAAFIDSIKTATVFFGIDENWLEGNPGDIGLAEYTDNGWEVHDASLSSADEEYVYYKTDVTKLSSPFAIVSITEEGESGRDGINVGVQQASGGNGSQNTTSGNGENNGSDAVGSLSVAIILTVFYFVKRR
jgi:PGF-pre-PGF domain-containing protein